MNRILPFLTFMILLSSLVISIDTDMDGIEDDKDLYPNDFDNDGMPDEWEMKHGFDPGNINDADEDFDNDNRTNLEEYLAGSDPRKPPNKEKDVEQFSPDEWLKDPVIVAIISIGFILFILVIILLVVISGKHNHEVSVPPLHHAPRYHLQRHSSRLRPVQPMPEKIEPDVNGPAEEKDLKDNKKEDEVVSGDLSETKREDNITKGKADDEKATDNSQNPVDEKENVDQDKNNQYGDEDVKNVELNQPGPDTQNPEADQFENYNDNLPYPEEQSNDYEQVEQQPYQNEPYYETEDQYAETETDRSLERLRRKYSR